MRARLWYAWTYKYMFYPGSEILGGTGVAVIKLIIDNYFVF